MQKIKCVDCKKTQECRLFKHRSNLVKSYKENSYDIKEVEEIIDSCVEFEGYLDHSHMLD